MHDDDTICSANLLQLSAVSYFLKVKIEKYFLLILKKPKHSIDQLINIDYTVNLSCLPLAEQLNLHAINGFIPEVVCSVQCAVCSVHCAVTTAPPLSWRVSCPLYDGYWPTARLFFPPPPDSALWGGQFRNSKTDNFSMILDRWTS